MTEKPTLLAVGDEEEILDDVERTFHGDFKVIRSDSQSALQVVKTAAVEIVVCDQGADAGGLALLGQLAEKYPTITRLLIAGFADLPQVGQAAAEGVIHAYVVKPLEDRRLKDAWAEAQARVTLGEWQTDHQGE